METLTKFGAYLVRNSYFELQMIQEATRKITEFGDVSPSALAQILVEEYHATHDLVYEALARHYAFPKHEISMEELTDAQIKQTKEILDTLPENAVYVSDSDHGSFSLLYLQAVEGKRPDVINARTYGYVSFPDTGDLPGPLRGEAGPFPRRGLEPQIFEWYLRHGDRPLYFEKPPAFPPESGIRLASQGLLWRALRPGEAAPPPRPLPEWTGDDGFAGDFTRDLILCDLHLARAREHYQAMRDNGGEPNDARGRLARREADQALAVYGNDAAMANNAGTLCAKYGDL